MVKHISIFLLFVVSFYLSNLLTGFVKNSFSHEMVLKLLIFVLTGSFYTAAIYLWNCFVWKIFAGKLHIPPDINGKYSIKIRSSYNQDKCYEGIAEIIQTYDTLYINSNFGKSEGKSCIAKIAKCNSQWHLLYSYYNLVTDLGLQEVGGNDHNGFSELKIEKEKGNISLRGVYANYGRGTRGNITFTKINK